MTQALVFDAYGTLSDEYSVVARRWTASDFIPTKS